VTSHIRNWYLGALGIVRYIPRDCPKSFAREYTSAEGDPVVADESMPVGVTIPEQTDFRDQPGGGKAAVDDSAQGKIEAPLVQTASQARQPSVKPLATSEQESVQFRLGFWQPSPQLVVLSAMPPGARADASHQDMLANLLKAIQQLPGDLASAELIDWPLSPGTSANLSGARELIDAFLEVKAKLQPFSLALLMGEMTARLVSEDGANTTGDRIHLRCQAEGIVTHSLHDMSANPGLKRETWEAIRFLAKNQ